jgi:hypothetical protein
MVRHRTARCENRKKKVPQRGLGNSIAITKLETLLQTAHSHTAVAIPWEKSFRNGL